MLVDASSDFLSGDESTRSLAVNSLISMSNSLWDVCMVRYRADAGISAGHCQIHGTTVSSTSALAPIAPIRAVQ